MVIAVQVPDPKLDRLLDAIVERLRPELVLLYGSRARGDAREDSDYDLMVVMSDDRDADECHRAARDATRSITTSVDITVVNASGYQRRQHDPGFIEWIVSREGRVLYSAGLVPQRSPLSGRVSERSNDGVKHWMARAESDWRAVSALDPTWVPDVVSFHAHACVEKLLKAMIVKQRVFPPRIHDLSELLRRMPASLRGDARLAEACNILWDLYPKSRYYPKPMPTAEEARRSVAAAHEARDILLEALSNP